MSPGAKSEHWTTADVARELGLASADSARRLLSRWRQEGNPAAIAVGRDPDTDAKLYDPDLIRAAHDARPGRGANLRSRTTTEPATPRHVASRTEASARVHHHREGRDA